MFPALSAQARDHPAASSLERCLARLVDLRYAHHGAEPMSNALIQALKQELTPSLCGDGGGQPCVQQDPIKRRQLQLYRLGYE